MRAVRAVRSFVDNDPGGAFGLFVVTLFVVGMGFGLITGSFDNGLPKPSIPIHFSYGPQ